MVQQFIAAEGITNPRVLSSLSDVPRHEFVRPSLRPQAYFDQALDIGHKQTISPPYIVAYMTEMLDPQPEDRVLEIGTGSGYQAAVLSSLVHEVYTIEIVEPLGLQAAARLRRLRYDNVHTRVGDGYQGWPDHAPFDKIIVTCSPESVPQPLVEQLRDGGRMIVPLGERYQQVFYLFEKQGTELVKTQLQPTLFVPMTGRSEELRRELPDGSHPRIINTGFEDRDADSGRADHWHYQRRVTIVADGSPEGEHHACFENSVMGLPSHMLQGFAVDGQQVAALTVSLQMKAADILAAPNPQQRPALLVHFYDEKRLPIGQAVVGPWLTDTDGWVTRTEQIPLPGNVKEAILQVGLNGATGQLCVDAITLTAQSR